MLGMNNSHIEKLKYENPFIKRWRDLSLVGFGYCLSFYVLFSISGMMSGLADFSLWYPAAGVRFALIFVMGWRYGLIAAIAEITAQGMTGEWASWGYHPGFIAFGMSTSLMVYCPIVALMQHYKLLTLSLNRFSHVGWLCVAALIAPALAAPLSVLGQIWGGRMPVDIFWPATLSFWTGDIVGILMVAPFAMMLIVAFQNKENLISVVHLKWRKTAEFSAVFGLTAFYMLKVGMAEASFLWLLLAFPVIWISLRHGFVWAAASVFSINILALLIALDMAAQARVDLQLFLALVSLLGLLLGGLITSRRRAKTTVKNQHKTIAQLDRMKSMGDMAAKVYHEIGQPLSTLNMITQGAIDQLEKGELDAEGLKRIMKLSQRENTRLSNLVSSMKAFAKDGKLVRSDTSVQEIIGTIKSLTDLTAEMASMTVTYDIPKGPLPLNVDKTLIGQAIFNLVKNSIEAMENSKVKQVTISAGLNDNGHTYISVTDTGPGFPDDFALGQTTKPDGMGLGLQIVNDIMDSHGGVVELKSSKALLRI